MPTSQYTVYSSADASAPVIDGNAGSLINVLDGILVTGYGAKSPPSPAWTHPVATSGNIASYKQPSGAGLSLVINDNAPNGTSLGKEAWAIGWESVAGVGSPVGSGGGQFPTPAQLLTSGHTVVRKSTATGGATRTWLAFADSYDFKLFIQTGDSGAVYFPFFYGDIFSLKGATDAYRVLLMARSVENNTTQESGDYLGSITASQTGHFMARTYGGGGTSILVGKMGDTAKVTTPGTPIIMVGNIQTPNGPDNAYYLCPVSVNETVAACVRGRIRGLYHILHPLASFADGQQLVGANDYAGKTIQVVKPSLIGGMWGVEISATLETN